MTGYNRGDTMLDKDKLAREFPHADGLIYLNHAAVSPWPARTAAAVDAFAKENIHYGASHYPAWLEVESNLRGQLQRLINAPSSEDIALLKNTSEGISVVAEGIDWQQGDNIVTTDEEFPSNRIPWQAQARHGVSLREISLRGEDPEADLMAACDGNTRLMTVSSVQFASGFRLDLERLGRHCEDLGILFCIDAIQSLGAIRLDVQSVHADFVMADAHKWMLGPEGIALFYASPRGRDQLTLHQYGWHMLEKSGNYTEREWQPASTAKRFECGSNNLMGIHALNASLSLFEDLDMAMVEAAVMENAAYLMDGLGRAEGVSLLTPDQPGRFAGIVSFSHRSKTPEELHRRLQQAQVICACRGGGVRLSPHFYTDREKLDKTLEIININD